MQNASAYLLQLVALSQDATGATWQPPSMSWTLKGTKEDHNSVATSSAKADCIKDEDLEFANRQPAMVSVVPKLTKGKATAAKSKASQKNKISEASEQEDNVSLPSPDSQSPKEFQAADSLQPATAGSAAAGAPPRTVVEAPPKTASKCKPKTAAAAKCKPKVKAKCKPKVKAKAAAKPALKRKAPGWLPLPDGAREKMQKLNHSKCRGKGCPACRQKIGLILNAEETAWVWDPAATA